MSHTPVLEPAVPARPQPRKFNLVDSMILTAAAAIALMPPWDQYLIHVPSKFRTWSDWIGHLSGRRIIPPLSGLNVGSLLAKDVLSFVVGLLTNPLIGLTLAVVWLRLRQPRPSVLKLVRQPGFVACVAAPVGFLVFLEANYLGAEIRPGPAVGGAIATAWVLLVAGRGWDAEPGWIDRLGRVVGVAWITAVLCEMLERSI